VTRTSPSGRRAMTRMVIRLTISRHMARLADDAALTSCGSGLSLVGGTVTSLVSTQCAKTQHSLPLSNTVVRTGECRALRGLRVGVMA
jgi:hypothetical protein